MLEETDEKIDCKILFQKGKAIPLSIFWEKKWYEIKEVLLRWEERKGETSLRHFSVTDGINTFHIVFHSDTMKWKLMGFDTEI
jgi:hypothetical protein